MNKKANNNNNWRTLSFNSVVSVVKANRGGGMIELCTRECSRFLLSSSFPLTSALSVSSLTAIDNSADRGRAFSLLALLSSLLLSGLFVVQTL